MKIAYQKVRRISCASACVFEILHSVQDDKMKAYFYFDTPSFRQTKG